MKKRFRPNSHGEPAADRQDDGVGDQIRRQHPGALVVARAKVARHVRQRHVGDARVEDLHERGQRDDNGNQPRIERGCHAASGILLLLTLLFIAGALSVRRSCPAGAGDR